jgi:hypothetical protein
VPDGVLVGDIELLPVLDAAGELGELDELYPETPAAEWEPYRELYPELFADTRWRVPGASYFVRSSGTTILVDTGVPAFLHEPDWVYVSDGDPGWCAETRRALLPQLVDRDVVVACGHYPRGGIDRSSSATA